MLKRLFIIICLGISFTRLFAQVVYFDKIYSPLIKTVQLYQSGQPLSEPVVYLSRQNTLVLEFDDLREQTMRYEYTLVHCSSDWIETPMEQSLYIEGFEIQPIENYNNSFNTLQRYVHYTQVIPSQSMKILKSGNYALKVFTENNPENVVFTKRFYCVDDRAEVECEVKQSSITELMNTHQEVNVKVVPKDNSFFASADKYMKVLVYQNQRQDDVHQLRLRGNSMGKMDYSFDVSNQFFAGNEFRFFDFTSLRLRTQYIAGFDFINQENQVYLLKEQDKSRKPYSSQKDINGQYLIRNEYGENDIQSDYAWVHFFLPKEINLEGSYYVVGQMTNGQMTTSNQMKFEDNQYHLALYLKQGYYNYQILFKRPDSLVGSYTQVEGNHWQTNNRYKIIVYYHNFADNYDEIVAYADVEFNK